MSSPYILEATVATQMIDDALIPAVVKAFLRRGLLSCWTHRRLRRRTAASSMHGWLAAMWVTLTVVALQDTDGSVASTERKAASIAAQMMAAQRAGRFDRIVMSRELLISSRCNRTVTRRSQYLSSYVVPPGKDMLIWLHDYVKFNRKQQLIRSMKEGLNPLY